MSRPLAVICKDCGSTAVGWWKGRYKHPGAASCRCEPCYLAYTRARFARTYVARPRQKYGPRKKAL